MLGYKLIFSSFHICWAISASLGENIIYDSSNNDCYLGSAEQHCQFGKSTLRQKVWKFTVDKLTNYPALVRAPGVQILSSQAILHPFPPLQLSEVTTQYYQEFSHSTRTFTIHSYSSHSKDQHTFRYFSKSHHNHTSHKE